MALSLCTRLCRNIEQFGESAVEDAVRALQKGSLWLTVADLAQLKQEFKQTKENACMRLLAAIKSQQKLQFAQRLRVYWKQNQLQVETSAAAAPIASTVAIAASAAIAAPPPTVAIAAASPAIAAPPSTAAITAPITSPIAIVAPMTAPTQLAEHRRLLKQRLLEQQKLTQQLAQLSRDLPALSSKFANFVLCCALFAFNNSNNDHDTSAIETELLHALTQGDQQSGVPAAQTLCSMLKLRKEDSNGGGALSRALGIDNYANAEYATKRGQGRPVSYYLTLFGLYHCAPKLHLREYSFAEIELQTGNGNRGAALRHLYKMLWRTMPATAATQQQQQQLIVCGVATIPDLLVVDQQQQQESRSVTKMKCFVPINVVPINNNNPFTFKSGYFNVSMSKVLPLTKDHVGHWMHYPLEWIQRYCKPGPRAYFSTSTALQRDLIQPLHECMTQQLSFIVYKCIQRNMDIPVTLEQVQAWHNDFRIVEELLEQQAKEKGEEEGDEDVDVDVCRCRGHTCRC